MNECEYVFVSLGCVRPLPPLCGQLVDDVIPVWLPSSGSTMLPLTPAPQLRFVSASGLPVLLSDVSCNASLVSPAGATLFSPPIAGYTASAVTGQVTLNRVMPVPCTRRRLGVSDLYVHYGMKASGYLCLRTYVRVS